jgi:TolB-like protein
VSIDSILRELKRRRVWRLVGLYAVAAWAVVQVAATVFPLLEMEWAAAVVVVLALAGFPVAVCLAWIYDWTATGVQRTAPLDGSGAPAAAAPVGMIDAAQAHRRALGFFGVGILVAIAGLAAYARYQPFAAGSPSEPIRSIAVLPFADMSSGQDQDYFSDGVAEELLNRLAQIDALHVAARTSSFAFKGRNEDVAEIGRKLRVQAVLEGSVRREGDHVRITAQLIDARTGYHLWSNNYDREVTSIFAIQDEIAEAIVTALEVQFATTHEASAGAGTSSTAAHDLYLRGLARWNARTDASLRDALALFTQALAEDSTYARAWAGLAMTYALLPTFGEFPHEEALEKGSAAAARAIALDAMLAEAHGALGQIAQTFEWDLAGAERAYERAVTFNPAYATGHQWFAETLLMLGRPDSAHAAIDRAVALDPLSPAALLVQAYVQLVRGDVDGSIVAHRDLLRLFPDFTLGHTNLLLACLAAGRYDDAEAVIPRIAADDATAAAMRTAIGGMRDPARRADALAAAAGLERTLPPALAALWSAALGDRSRALDALERAVDEGTDGNVPFILLHPLLGALRGDARMQAIADRVGVVLPVN